MAVITDPAAAELPPGGYGDGSGSGDGDGDGEYWRSAAAAFGGESAQRAASEGATIAFWRSGPKGQPTNGGRGVTAEVGAVHEVSGPLELCTAHALHATYAPWKWGGARLWVVALHGEVQEDDDKLGALKREILAEVVPNPFAGRR